MKAIKNTETKKRQQSMSIVQKILPKITLLLENNDLPQISDT